MFIEITPESYRLLLDRESAAFDVESKELYHSACFLSVNGEVLKIVNNHASATQQFYIQDINA